MCMCIHGSDYETCQYGCTFRKKEELKLENDKFKANLRQSLKREEEAEAKNKLLIAKNKLLRKRVKRLKKIITCAIEGIASLPPSWDEEAENKLAAIKQNLKQ